MTTLLEGTLKRQLSIGGRTYILAVSPEGLKLTLKGRRKGLELQWDALVSGDAALAIALNASLGSFAAGASAQRQPSQPAMRPKGKSSPATPEVRRRISEARRAGTKHKANRR